MKEKMIVEMEEEIGTTTEEMKIFVEMIIKTIEIDMIVDVIEDKIHVIVEMTKETIETGEIIEILEIIIEMIGIDKTTEIEIETIIETVGVVAVECEILPELREEMNKEETMTEETQEMAEIIINQAEIINAQITLNLKKMLGEMKNLNQVKKCLNSKAHQENN
jgi:hypothetical protein